MPHTIPYTRAYGSTKIYKEHRRAGANALIAEQSSGSSLIREVILTEALQSHYYVPGQQEGQLFLECPPRGPGKHGLPQTLSNSTGSETLGISSAGCLRFRIKGTVRGFIKKLNA